MPAAHSEWTTSRVPASLPRSITTPASIPRGFWTESWAPCDARPTGPTKDLAPTHAAASSATTGGQDDAFLPSAGALRRRFRELRPIYRYGSAGLSIAATGGAPDGPLVVVRRGRHQARAGARNRADESRWFRRF